MAIPLALGAALAAILLAYSIFIVWTWRHEHRLPGRLPKHLQKTRELEPLLAPDEKVVWEGRPIGFTWPPLAHRVSYATLAVLMLAAPAGIAAFALSGTTARTWKLSLATVRIDATYAPGTVVAPSGLVPPGFTPTSTGGGTAFLTATSISLPSPFILVGFVGVLIAWEELRRFAGFRSRRYAITDRRVLKLDPWEKTLLEIARGDVKSASVVGDALVITGSEREIRFEKIEDPAAARWALGDVPGSERK